MSKSSQFDNFSRLVNGTYRQNALFIKIDSMNDLMPEGEDIIPSALPVNIHEYIHYLHNVSTVAGQYYLFSNLMLMRFMVQGCDDSGTFLGEEYLSKDVLNSTRNIIKNMQCNLGTTSTSLSKKNKNIKQWRFSIPKTEESKAESNIYVKTESEFSIASSTEVEKQADTIIIGLSFITEGIAYEVERVIYRNNGTPESELDKTTPVFPYLTYKEAIQSWSNRVLDSESLIRIGIVSLSSFYPGDLLAKICHDLRNLTISVDDVLNHYMKDYEERSNQIIKFMSEQREAFSKGDAIYTAMGEYFHMINLGANLRKKNFEIELEFLNDINNADDFYKKIKSMIDYNLIQLKTDNKVEIYWIGPGEIVSDNKKSSSVGALQSMIHYSQLHIQTDGSLVETTKLNNTACPLCGGCVTESEQQLQEVCKTTPWANYKLSQPGELVCWYAAGVKALRSAAK